MVRHVDFSQMTYNLIWGLELQRQCSDTGDFFTFKELQMMELE